MYKVENVRASRVSRKVRVTEHWHRLSTEVVESPSFEIIQKPFGHGPGQLV